MAEDKVEVLRAGCFFCHVRCGVLVTKVNGRITNIEGDPDCPHNKGYTCSRLDKQRYLEGFVYNPNRLKKPLKRVGEARRRPVGGDLLGPGVRRDSREAGRAARRVRP